MTSANADLWERLLASEALVRVGFFLGVLVLMMALEAAFPRRVRTVSRGRRWPGNLGIVMLDSLIVRALVPMAAVGVAMIAEARGWGLFHALGLPTAWTVLLSVLALDLVIYLQHVVFHAVPALWRLHRMHHADLDIDVTTGARFHPIEILLSMGIKMAVVAALGAPAVGVVIFEVLLNATSMFNHANLNLPRRFDRVLRWLVVTPDMHRVHHSAIRRETDSNFGFNLPWWDRLLGTYRDQPEKGHDGMTIGLPIFRDPGASRLDRLLIQPFLNPPRQPLPDDKRPDGAG
ncbi:sterol desaturase family protein [Shumkonia mesophila]|uniref:sterol desaturase family protein n=1 Tax=Shumkonia mesophila TaxID=2838854 RepID=UPI0029346FB3|nr:sterol desaturase family protein [Shumkonia mesophila]